MEDVSGVVGMMDMPEMLHGGKYSGGNVRPPMAETTPLTVSGSFKDGGRVSGLTSRRRSSRRPSLDTDEFMNLLHGSDPVKLELNRLENEVRDKDRELNGAQAEIKGLKLSERLREKAVEELTEELTKVDEKLKLTESLLDTKVLGKVDHLPERSGIHFAEQLKDIGCKWVILGHSERRHVIGEDDQFIGKKAAYALGQNLGVMACIGELLEEREADKTFDVCFKQLKAYADAVSSWDNIVIAYEPVWAIGTGKVASPEQAQEVHVAVRDWLAKNVSAEVASKTRIIYGGSVNPGNSADLAKKEDIWLFFRIGNTNFRTKRL